MAAKQRERENGAKLEGVFAKGYGVVPRLVMQNPELSPEARLLYAYFCVVSGNDGGYQPCPPEDLILSTLNISHTRYLRHRKSLTEGGYLRFRQSRKPVGGGRQLYEGAQFLVIKRPGPEGEKSPFEAPKAPFEPEEGELSLNALAAVQEGVFSMGFGLVPRIPLFDRQLSIEAKALYVFLCLYASASLHGEREAQVKADFLEARLMGRKRVQNAARELEKAGYIERRQRRAGAFGGNVYVLCFDPKAPREESERSGSPERAQVQNDTAESLSSKVKNDTAENPEFSLAYTEVSPSDTFSSKGKIATSKASEARGKNATAENETAKIPTAKNETAIIETNTKPESISFTNSPSVKTTADRQAGAYGRMAASIQRAEQQLEAEILREVYDPDLVDGIVLELARVYAMDPETQLRADGRMLFAMELQTVYGRLRFRHIEQVIRSLREADASALRNPQAYLRSCLYNAPFTLGLQDLLKLGEV